MKSGPLMPQVPAVAAVRAIEHLLSRPHETIHSVAVALATRNVLDKDLRLPRLLPRAWSFTSSAAAPDGRNPAAPNGGRHRSRRRGPHLVLDPGEHRRHPAQPQGADGLG